jgi:hypothetical protein
VSNAIIVEPLAMPVVTASATAAGYDPSYVDGIMMGVVWKSPTGAATRTLTVDLGADKPFDTIALFGLTGAQPGWTLKVDAATSAQGSSFPGGSWSGTAATLLAGTEMPTSGRGKSLWLAPDVSPPPASRYIRLTFGSLSNAAVTVARVAIGKRIQLDHNFVFGAAFGVRDLGSFDFSARAVPLRRRGEKLRSTGLSFPHTHRSEVEAAVNPLIERIGNTEAIVVVTDPDAHAQRQNRMYFGPLVGDLGVVWSRADGFEARVNIVGLDR